MIIKILKPLLGDEICFGLLFGHAFSGCDTSSIFGVGKKTIFHKVVNSDPVLRAYLKTFSSSNMDPESIEAHGCRLTVSLVNKKEDNKDLFISQQEFVVGYSKATKQLLLSRYDKHGERTSHHTHCCIGARALRETTPIIRVTGIITKQ